MSKEDIKLVIVGSLALDTIETVAEMREELLGGSVSYACAAASFFMRSGMVAVAGSDFPPEHLELYKTFNIDMEGLEQVEGKTFRWSGRYEQDMNQRSTISTELNVFAEFSPKLPESYSVSPFILLGNIQPSLQLNVLEQARNARFVVADTMDIWINGANEELMELIAKVNMLTLNDSEAKLLTGKGDLLSAAASIHEMGPEYVLIKKGEHGALLSSGAGIFLSPAFPLRAVNDPTGAGDTFAGAMMGYLAACGEVNDANVREAIMRGTIVASFGVEEFSLDRLARLEVKEIAGRLDDFRKMLP